MGGSGSAAGNLNLNRVNTRSANDVSKQTLATTSRTSPEVAELVTGTLANILVNMFNIMAGEINTSLALSYFSVNSLVAVQLRNWLNATVEVIGFCQIFKATTANFEHAPMASIMLGICSILARGHYHLRIILRIKASTTLDYQSRCQVTTH